MATSVDESASFRQDPARGHQKVEALSLCAITHAFQKFFFVFLFFNPQVATQTRSRNVTSSRLGEKMKIVRYSLYGEENARRHFDETGSL